MISRNSRARYLDRKPFLSLSSVSEKRRGPPDAAPKNGGNPPVQPRFGGHNWRAFLKSGVPAWAGSISVKGTRFLQAVCCRRRPTRASVRKLLKSFGDKSCSLKAQRALSRAARNGKEHAFRRRRGRDPFCASSKRRRLSPFAARRAPPGKACGNFRRGSFVRRSDRPQIHIKELPPSCDRRFESRIIAWRIDSGECPDALVGRSNQWGHMLYSASWYEGRTRVGETSEHLCS